MNYEIEALSEKNCKDLIGLYKKVFKINMSLKKIKKKFDSTCYGKPYFGHIAYFNKKPVAFYGAIIMEMKFNETYELSAQSVDSMTLKNHAGRGLFTKLAFLTFTELENNGIKFIWGFANQNSESPVLKKLGYAYNERIIGFSAACSKFPLESLCRKNKVVSKFYDIYIHIILKKYKVNDKIKNSASTFKNSITVVRDSFFYSSKSNNGNFTIRIDDVIFWVKIKNGLHIGDIYLIDNEIVDVNKFHKAFIKLKHKASLLGVKTITIQSSPSTLITKLFKNIPSEKFNSWSVCYKNFFSSFPLENLKLTYGDIDSF